MRIHILESDWHSPRRNLTAPRLLLFLKSNNNSDRVMRGLARNDYRKQLIGTCGNMQTKPRKITKQQSNRILPRRQYTRNTSTLGSVGVHHAS